MAISNVDKIILSFKKYMQGISGLDCFLYTESDLDLESVLETRAKVDLPLGTETSFIVQFFEAGSWWDLTGTMEKYDVLKRYVKITLPSNSSVKYILIESYNSTTGEITLAEPFGEAIATTDTFEIVVLDSIFIKDLLSFSKVGGSSKFDNKFLRMDIDIKTKEDAKRQKSRLFQELISSEVGKYRKMSIYDEDLITLVGYLNFEDNGTFSEKLDSADQLVKYLGSFATNYHVNNFG